MARAAMIDYGRATRLRTLISELERAAPSEARGALLQQARHRVADLESLGRDPSAWPLRRQGMSFAPRYPEDA